MNDNIKSIADLLPEGLSESAVTEICQLVDSVITEQVDQSIHDLEAKVHAFIRFKMDELKDQALAELENDHEVVRNNNIFEQIKSLMAIELTEEDDKTALASLMKESHEVSQERDLVIDEYNKTLYENEDLQNTIKVLSDRLDNLEKENTEYQTTVTELQESKEKPFKSSERAKMINADVDQPVKETHPNEFLTEEVMKFMPFNNS